MKTGKSGSRSPINLMWIGMLFSMFYWFLESVRDVLVFEKGKLFQSIFFPDPMSFLMRLLVVCIIVLFGVYAQSVRGKEKDHKRERHRFLRMIGPIKGVFVLGALYWILESVRDVFIFGRGDILDRILTPDTRALWMRLLGVFILLLFGIYVQALINERKKAEEKLQKQSVKLEEEVERRTELHTVNKELQQEVTERKLVEDKLRSMLKEKEILLKEIHHRVKNNLQIIWSLLHLQEKNIMTEQARTILKESRNRIKSMAFIHDRLYHSEDFSNIDLTEYIENLTSNLFYTLQTESKSIKLITDVKNIFLSLDSAIPFGLIINELVTNALKYAFPNDKSGEIRISFHSDKDKIHTLIVGDNGEGLPENLDIHNTKTLGLRLVSSLVEQLEGSIDVDRNGGTTYKVVFQN